MIGSAIREISAARTSPLICAAFVEKTAQIWDVDAQQKVGEFSARFSFGAENLAMHPDGGFVVTGSSAARGGSIASYRVPDGHSEWRRDRLPYPACIRFGQSGQDVYYTLQDRRVERTNALTGVPVEVFRDTNHYFEGPGAQALIAPVSTADYLLVAEHKIPIPKLTFAILDVVFGATSLCITESAGPVRCIDYLTGTEQWRYTPAEGSHVLRLHYNRLDGFFYGVLWHYQKGHFRNLIRVDPNTGQTARVRELKSSWEAFIEVTQQLVTSAGDVIDLSSGRTVGELAFPRKEYADRFTLT
jgi:hypothetical protein